MTHPVVGITGLPCTGKDEAAKILAAEGAHIVDVDRVGHAILEEPAVREAVRARFGEPVAPPGQPVNRKALGTIAFSDERALDDLETILHPRMTAAVRTETAATRQRQPVVIHAAVLHRMGLDADCDRVLVVVAALPARLERALARGWNEAELAARDKALADVAQTARRNDTVVVRNDGSLDKLRGTLRDFWKELNHATEKR